MAKKKTALHKIHVPTKLGIIIISVVALIMTLLVATQYNSQQNIFSNASADKGKIYSKVYPDKCLAAPANGKKGRVVIQTCKDGDPAQQWERSGGVVNRIYKNNNLCLETENMATSSGAFVQVGDCGSGNNPAEKWAEIDETPHNNNNGGVLKLHKINECLTGDKYQVNIGNNVKLLQCQKSYNSQAWHFLQVATSNGNGAGGSGGGGNGSGGGSGSGNGGGGPVSCASIGGTCESTRAHTNGNGGTYHAGLCPGASNIQCWVPGATGGGSSCNAGSSCMTDIGCHGTGGQAVAPANCNGIGTTCCVQSGSSGGGGSSYTCKITKNVVPNRSDCPTVYRWCSTINSCSYGRSCPQGLPAGYCQNVTSSQ